MHSRDTALILWLNAGVNSKVHGDISSYVLSGNPKCAKCLIGSAWKYVQVTGLCFCVLWMKIRNIFLNQSQVELGRIVLRKETCLARPSELHLLGFKRRTFGQDRNSR